MLTDNYILFHHRKTSIGKLSKENVHPFPLFDGRYYLMQNGSARELHGWGVMNFIESKEEDSDTFYLSRFLEERGADSFEKMGEVFGELENKKISLGVVVIYDTSTNTFMTLSDGARSMYIQINPLHTKIEYFSSISNTGSDEFSFCGWFVSDMEGNVLGSDFKYVNRFTKKYVTTITQSRQSIIEEEEDYYRNNPYWNGTQKHLPPPFSGDGSTQNGTTRTTTETTQSPLTEQTEIEINTVPDKRVTTVSSFLDRIAQGGTSDDIELDVEDLLETDVVGVLETQFDYIMNQGLERIIVGITDGPAMAKIINELKKVIELILSEYEKEKELWLDNFIDTESDKFRIDRGNLVRYINQREEDLQAQLMQLFQ